MASTRKQPMEFRQEDVSYVMERFGASMSVALVGTPSIGKSNLLQHLDDPEVRTQFMGERASRFHTIVIDNNMIGPLPTAYANNDPFRCWAGYELMLHRLYVTLYPFDMLNDDERARLEMLYQKIQDGTNPIYQYMGLRYLELAISLFTNHDLKLAFLFDEFDEMMRIVPVRFFQTMRGLRDINKKNLLFMTFTRAPLPILAERLSLPAADIEPFVELFTDNIHYVKGYNPTDAARMLSELMKRTKREYPPAVLDALATACGRFAGLMRAGFNTLEDLGSKLTFNPSPDDLARELASRGPVASECRAIWLSLSASEQSILKAVARITKELDNSPETAVSLRLLVNKGLLTPDGQSLRIEPPVFGAWVAQNGRQL